MNMVCFKAETSARGSFELLLICSINAYDQPTLVLFSSSTSPSNLPPMGMTQAAWRAARKGLALHWYEQGPQMQYTPNRV